MPIPFISLLPQCLDIWGKWGLASYSRHTSTCPGSFPKQCHTNLVLRGCLECWHCLGLSRKQRNLTWFFLIRLEEPLAYLWKHGKQLVALSKCTRHLLPSHNMYQAHSLSRLAPESGSTNPSPHRFSKSRWHEPFPVASIKQSINLSIYLTDSIYLSNWTLME